MAEDRHASDDELRAIVLGAISAAPTLTGIQPGVWIAKVNEAIPHVAAMMRRGLLPEHDSRQIRNAREVAEAEVFTGVYVSHEMDPPKAGKPPSTRVLVHFRSERQDAKAESIRTHRTDTAAGRTMQARLDKLESGARIVIYKAMEVIAGSEEGHKARTLVHFETLPQRTDTQQAAKSGSSPIPDRAPAAQGSPPLTIGGGDPDFGAAPDTPPPSRNTSDVDRELTNRFNDLPSHVKVDAVKRFRAEGIIFPTPEVDQIDRFVAILNEIEKDAS